MQYEYTVENEVPVMMKITYRELVLLDKLLEKENADDWRYDEMKGAVKTALQASSEYMKNYFRLQGLKINEETDDA